MTEACKPLNTIGYYPRNYCLVRGKFIISLFCELLGEIKLFSTIDIGPQPFITLFDFAI